MLMMYFSYYSQLLCDYKEIIRSGTGIAHSGAAAASGPLSVKVSCPCVYGVGEGRFAYQETRMRFVVVDEDSGNSRMTTRCPEAAEDLVCDGGGPGDRITLQDNLQRCETNTLLSRSSKVQGTKLVLFNSCDKQFPNKHVVLT